jgi:uncharacterized membrane protein YcaP (DUF421 family)
MKLPNPSPHDLTFVGDNSNRRAGEGGKYMEDFSTIILRTIFMYFLILVTFRLMGKREIGQLTILDFVVSIMIAELAVISIEDPGMPLLRTVASISVLLLIQTLLAFISLKSEKIRHYVDGRPTTIIDKGKIDEEEMRKQRYNFDDLLVQLREKKIKNVSDVEFAILEPNGNLSVFEKENEDKGGDHDLDIPLPLILDGKVQKTPLERIHQTPLWLRQQLRKLGYKDIKKISYCALTKDGTFFVDEKDE